MATAVSASARQLTQSERVVTAPAARWAVRSTRTTKILMAYSSHLAFKGSDVYAIFDRAVTKLEVTGVGFLTERPDPAPILLTHGITLIVH